MKKFMIVYIRADGTQSAKFTDDRNDANNVMIHTAFVVGSKAQMYEYDDEKDLYSFICMLVPKKRKEKAQ